MRRGIANGGRAGNKKALGFHFGSKKRLNFSINPRNYRYLNRSEAEGINQSAYLAHEPDTGRYLHVADEGGDGLEGAADGVLVLTLADFVTAGCQELAEGWRGQIGRYEEWK